MADIDIEEHDVLQDSKVMGIFPDLSLVKTEVLDDDNQENPNQPVVVNLEAVPDSTTGHDTPQPFQRASESPHVVSSTQEDATAALGLKIVGIQSSKNFFNNRIVLGQKPATATSVNDDQSKKALEDTIETCPPVEIPDETPTLEADAEKTDGEQSLDRSLKHEETEPEDDMSPKTVNNCIVLGQKPSPEPTQSYVSTDIDEEELMKCYSATIILDEWGPYLNTSDSYCKECEILFATVNAFDAHKMLTHSFLVAVDSKEPAPGTSKPFDPKKSCFVCQKTFTNHSDLIQHIYQHVEATHTCLECKKTFLSKKLLLEHMKVHVKDEPEVLPAPEPPIAPKDPLYKCTACGRIYSSVPAVRKHIIEKHAKLNVIKNKNYTVVGSAKCPTCGFLCQGKTAYIAHTLTHRKSETSLTRSSKSPSPPQDDVFVPKSTLFWCSECDVHFTSLSVALAHKESCPDTQSRDCQQCPLTLACACIKRHEIQHLYANDGDFDVVDVDTKNLAATLLCICPRCELNCSVNTLWRHVKSCPVASSYRCPVCELHIDKAAENEHRFAHDAHRFTKSDFIAIEYVTTDALGEESKDEVIQNVIKVGKKRRLDDDAESQSSKRSKDEDESGAEREFIYCEHCRFFMPKSDVLDRKHILGRCALKERRCFVCYTCGLVFDSILTKHKLLHEGENSTFANFKFFDLKGRPISPPLSEYQQCSKCECSFSQIKALKEHACPATEKIRCTHCNKYFSQMAHVLHMQNVRMLQMNGAINDGGSKLVYVNKSLVKVGAGPAEVPKRVYVNKKMVAAGAVAVKKPLEAPTELASSDKTTIYYCVGCRVCFLSVFHRKQTDCRTSNSMQYRRRTCEICGLIVLLESYSYHLGLHSKFGVTLKDFEFFNLWKVEFLTPPLPRYYPCGYCKVHFLTHKLLKKHDCDTVASSPCKVCKEKFTPETLKLHEPFHHLKKKPSAKDFLVYQCSVCTYVFSKSQAQNRHSCAGPKNASSHRCCETCHLNMYTEIYEQHVNDHDRLKIALFDPKTKPPAPGMATLHCDSCEIGYDFEVEKKKRPQGCPACGLRLSLKTPEYHTETPTVAKQRPKLYPRTERFDGSKLHIPQSAIPAYKMYTYYQCKYCNLTLRKREQIRMHLKRCSEKKKRKTAMAYCKICDLHLSLLHPRSHQRYPNLCKKTIQLVLCGKTQRQPLVILSVRQPGETKAEVRAPKVVARAPKIEARTPKTEARTPKIDVKARNAVAMARKIDVKTRQVILSASAKKQWKYTLHQCRNCGAHVSKSSRFMTHDCANMSIVHLTYCPVCKLNVMLSSYKYHMRYHALHPDMVPENIRVIPYGENRGARSVVVDAEFAETSSKFAKGKEKAEEDSESASVDVEEEEEFERTPEAVDARSSGPKYTLYKCNKCQGCVSSEKKAEMHENQPNCVDTRRDHCKICGLDMVVRFLRYHMDRHSYDPEFTRDNMRIVPFGEMAKGSELSPRVKFTLYQCAECLVCSDEQYDHFCDDVAKRTCDICQYDIESSYFSRHLECHKNVNYQRSAIRILPLDSADGDVTSRDVPRKRRVDGSLVTKKTVDVYKCACGLHFLCRKSLEKHGLSCRGVATEKSGLSCSKCRLVFDATQLLKHSISHHGNLNFDIKYNVVECDSGAAAQAEDVKEKRPAKPAKRPYHFKSKFQKPRPKKQCSICGESVIGNNFARHLKKHLEMDKAVKIGRKNKSNTANKKVMFKCGLCSVHFMDEAMYNSHRLKTKHIMPPKIQCKYCNLLIHQNDIMCHSLRFHRRTPMTIGSQYVLSKVLYYCSKCSIHYLTVTSLRRHVRTCRRRILLPHPCRRCGLAFTKPELADHLLIHHETQNFKREDFIIRNDLSSGRRDEHCADDAGDDQECSESADEETNNSFDTTASINGTKNIEYDVAKAGDDSESIYVEEGDEKLERSLDAIKARDASEPKYTLYRCNKCQGCVSCEKKAEMHKEQLPNCVDLKRNHCKICGLDMVVRFLRYHMEKHSNEPEFTRDNIRIVPFGERAKDSEMTSAHESKDKEDDIETVSFDETNGNEDRDDDATSAEDDDEAESVVSAAEIAERKCSKETKKVANDTTNKVQERKRAHKGLTYYKCTACNVYFLQYNNIQKHLVRHKPMTEYDFIECKLCKMNFKLNSLLSHMEHHRNKTFKLDEVLFMEYNPKGSEKSSTAPEEESPRLEKEEIILSTPEELNNRLGNAEPKLASFEEQNSRLGKNETVSGKENPIPEDESNSKHSESQNPRLNNEETSSKIVEKLILRQEKGEVSLVTPEEKNPRLQIKDTSSIVSEGSNQILEKDETNLTVPEVQNPMLEKETCSTVPEKQNLRLVNNKNSRLELEETNLTVPEVQNTILEKETCSHDPEKQNLRLVNEENPSLEKKDSWTLPDKQNSRPETDEKNLTVPEVQNPRLERETCSTNLRLVNKDNPRLEKKDSSNLPDKQNSRLETEEINLTIPEVQNSIIKKETCSTDPEKQNLRLVNEENPRLEKKDSSTLPDKQNSILKTEEINLTIAEVENPMLEKETCSTDPGKKNLRLVNEENPRLEKEVKSSTFPNEPNPNLGEDSRTDSFLENNQESRS